MAAGTTTETMYNILHHGRNNVTHPPLKLQTIICNNKTILNPQAYMGHATRHPLYILIGPNFQVKGLRVYIHIARHAQVHWHPGLDPSSLPAAIYFFFTTSLALLGTLTCS